MKKCQRLTGGLAQAGQWLARKFVRIWKFRSRPNGSGSPAFAKPLGRCTQAARTVQFERRRVSIRQKFTENV